VIEELLLELDVIVGDWLGILGGANMFTTWLELVLLLNGFAGGLVWALLGAVWLLFKGLWTWFWVDLLLFVIFDGVLWFIFGAFVFGTEFWIFLGGTLLLPTEWLELTAEVFYLGFG
jgi:hypothetical protein